MPTRPRVSSTITILAASLLMTLLPSSATRAEIPGAPIGFGENIAHTPVWSPDSLFLLATVFDRSSDGWVFERYDVRSGAIDRFTVGPDAGRACISPGGRYIAFWFTSRPEPGGGFAMRMLDTATRRVSVVMSPNNLAGGCQFSDDGSLVTDHRSVVELATGAEMPLPVPPGCVVAGPPPERPASPSLRFVRLACGNTIQVIDRVSGQSYPAGFGDVSQFVSGPADDGTVYRGSFDCASAMDRFDFIDQRVVSTFALGPLSNGSSTLACWRLVATAGSPVLVGTASDGRYFGASEYPTVRALATFDVRTGTARNLGEVPIGPEQQCRFQPVNIVPSPDTRYASYFDECQAPSTQRRLFVVDLWRLPKGSISQVDTVWPAGARAALVNLTMVDGASSGYITADACGSLTPGPQTRSSGNHGRDRAIANLAVVPLDGRQRLCVFNQTAVNLVVDSQGYFGSPGLGGQDFFPSAPDRRLDTREAGGVRDAGSVTRVETGVPAGTTAVLVNLTMVDGIDSGFITADRCSALQPGPQTKSSGNHGPGAAIANLAVVPVDADGSFCVFNQRPVNLVVDLQGSFAPAASFQFFLTTPSRLLDTRSS